MARIALDLCVKHNIKIAVLADNGPSCGCSFIYDGIFSNKKINGLGVTAALLRGRGIDAFNQYDIELTHSELQRLCGFKQSKRMVRLKRIRLA